MVKHIPGKPYADGSMDIMLPFSVPRDKSNSEVTGKKRPPFAHAFCPKHTSDRRTGIVVSGPHLQWVTHYIKIGKNSIPCSMSDKNLCEGTSLDGKMLLVMIPKKRASDTMHGIRDARCRHGDLDIKND